MATQLEKHKTEKSATSRSKRFTFFTWKRLSTLGNIQFLRISYAVLIGVPLIASIQRTAFSAFWEDIPTTLRLGYFASLLLSIAHMVYQGYCPQIIKRFESPNDLYRDMLEIKALQQQYLSTDTAFQFDIGHCRKGFVSANYRNPKARLACGVLYAIGLVLALFLVAERSAIVLGITS